MPKNDPIYRSFEGYTKFFAEQMGGPELLRKVVQFFDNNDPIAAAAAASKV
ncbi:hypothetical protein PC119_g10653 [Phytophthora cactorum]|uniref:Uncharacterized protein n=1 Tax=Phytophthora cactorum TaxID=29920 RepID=A0A8T1BFE0_9STRA|nr:hypothetical protein PC114_g16856 [Phytophthora cactorum]KAG2902554.1 hypothetical protein PC117_g21448 [Phytophthora cactorum]KAG3018508.1 hypothetical protein PC119_g10653 [Phytophthora cactorum]KAG4044113.1 hypothetical protein PC123_g20431 [Phytophthora cactorum]